MNDSPRVGLHTDADGTVIVSGDLDVANAAALHRRLSEEDCPLMLDLAAVTFIDGAAIRVLLAHRERCTARGQDFRIVAASKAVTRALDLAGLAPIFGVEVA